MPARRSSCQATSLDAISKESLRRDWSAARRGQRFHWRAPAVTLDESTRTPQACPCAHARTRGSATNTRLLRQHTFERPLHGRARVCVLVNDLPGAVLLQEDVRAVDLLAAPRRRCRVHDCGVGNVPINEHAMAVDPGASAIRTTE